VLKEVVQPKAQKKFYSEALKDEEAAAAQKAGDFPIAEPLSDRISELDPEADFMRFLKDRTVDRVNQAIAQMQEMITRLVEHSFRGNTYDKALSCIRCLRQGCLDEDETGQFNAFMQMQVKGMEKTHPDFWTRLVDAGISLISKAESDTSLVEPAEAVAFLVKTVRAASQKPAEDDLLADIE
jgi:ATP-dependent DNA helicase 2 subunit 2